MTKFIPSLIYNKISGKNQIKLMIWQSVPWFIHGIENVRCQCGLYGSGEAAVKLFHKIWAYKLKFDPITVIIFPNWQVPAFVPAAVQPV